MEGTTIKYENCEDLYVGQEGAVPEEAHLPIAGKNITPCYEATPHSMKRSYNEFTMASGGIGVIGGHNFGASGNYHMGAVGGVAPGAQLSSHEQYRNFYASTQHASHLQQQQLQQPLLPQDALATPKKRFRRGDKNILFGPPFFELQQDYDAIDPRSSLAARCLSCHVVLRGHKNVSSNFLKHMKRVHPEVYKIYENIKLLKFGVVKGSSSSASAASSSSAAAAAMAHDDVVNGSAETVTPDQTNHQFFDASAFLEHMSATAVAGDDAPSETTENSGTPPTSTEAIETPENSRESQQTQPQRQPVALEDEQLAVPQTTEREDNSHKIDLTHKNLDAKISQMLDTKLKAFVSKTEFSETTQIVSNLMERSAAQRTATQSTTPEEKPVSTTTTTSTTTTSTAALQTQLNALRQECQELRTHAQQAQQGKRQLQRELEAMDREVRRNKLIIRNLAVPNSDKPHEAVEQLFRERLELPDIELQSVTNISRNKAPHQRQTLLVELKDKGGKHDAKVVLRQCFKLKDSGVFIEIEMSPFARKRREKLLVLRKELLRRNADLKVRVQGTQLSVEGKQFYWDEVTGLCIGGSRAQDMAAVNAADYLKTVSGGLDLKEFLNVLQNYDVQMR